MDYKKELQQLVETVKRNAKTRGEKLTNQEIADIFGKKRTYLSDLLGTYGKVTEEHVVMFKEKFKAYLDDDAIVITDPIKELVKANIRLESKMDTLGLMFAAVMDILTPEQKNKVAKVLNNGDYEGKAAFTYFNEAAKKRAEFRIKRSKREEAE